MQISQLTIENFRGIKHAKLHFSGHTLLIGANNVGKSTICEALDLALGPERQFRFPKIDEFDFFNSEYINENGNPVPLIIEVILTKLSKTIERSCFPYLEIWDTEKRILLEPNNIEEVDNEKNEWCLRLITKGYYDTENDEFDINTYYGKIYNPNDDSSAKFPRRLKQSIGFLYLRALRTGSRALSFERGSLLDVILKIQGVQTGFWENIRTRLESLDPPIDKDLTEINPILKTIEERLSDYVSISQPGKATRLHVTQLTREHLRKTLSFFISVTQDQKPVPFQNVGTGTINTLVLALLTFIADIKVENVIFAMEEPEIAVPPHTQRRIIANYLLSKTSQCFVTSHSPYIIETFPPEDLQILNRESDGKVVGTKVNLDLVFKRKTYQRYIRRGLSEVFLGKGVIVVEGITEQYLFQVVSKKIEEDQNDLYPLDLSGVTIITTDGDGSVAEFGQFFTSLNIPCFAFIDSKNRSDIERQSIENANFTLFKEIPYKGMEELLIAELPFERIWEFYLSQIDHETPLKKTEEASIKKRVYEILKNGKGWGKAADLIDICSASELPTTIVTFLSEVYSHFPRPHYIQMENTEETKKEDLLF